MVHPLFGSLPNQGVITLNQLKKIVAASTLSVSAIGLSVQARADDYTIDPKGIHSFINFKVNLLGYNWLHGNFTNFGGDFTFDGDDPSKSRMDVIIKTASIDSHHTELDKHLRSGEFLDVSTFPEAHFVSTHIESTDGNNARIYGDFTLKGITKEIIIDAVKESEDKDPSGHYRTEFSGTTTLSLKDFKVVNLGPVSPTIDLTLEVEGIRQ